MDISVLSLKYTIGIIHGYSYMVKGLYHTLKVWISVHYL